MFCHKCGIQIADDALFCHKCGTKMIKISDMPNTPAALKITKPYQPKVTDAARSPKANKNIKKVVVTAILAAAGIGIICVIGAQKHVKTPSLSYSDLYFEAEENDTSEIVLESSGSFPYDYSSSVDKFPNENVNSNTTPNKECDENITYVPSTGFVTILGLEYDIANTTFLDLNNQNVTNETLKDIIKLSELAELRIWDTKVTDISLLSELPNLTILYLSGDDIEDIRPLAHMTGLNELYLFGTGISDISPLSALSELKIVDLGGNDIVNISPLAYCTNLETLYLHNEVINDLSPLENLPKLRSLSITYSEIGSITPLGYLTDLTYLNLEGTAVDSSDLNWLRAKLPGCKINI